MAKDFYLKSAKTQMQAIQTARAQAMAELEQARQSDDKHAAGAAVQQIADLAAAQENLQKLANQYVASQTRTPEVITPEERRVRPIEKMDWSDVVELARTSRYGKDIRPDDPNMIAGAQEAARRRGRGE